MFKIPCGGFELDESSFSLENKKLSTQPVSWNDLKDKPFGSNMTVITWDGNTDGKEEVRLGKNAYYKVSDLTPTIEEVSNHLAITLVLPQSGAEQTMTVPKDMIVPMSGEPGEMGAFWCGSDSPLFVLPEIAGDAKGIYLVCNKALVNMEWVTEGYVSNVEFGSIKTIDPKYLPSGSGGGGAFFINLSEDMTSVDKTYDEIVEAKNNGMVLCCVMGGMVYATTYSHIGTDFMFVATSVSENALVCIQVTIYENSVASVKNYAIPLT